MTFFKLPGLEKNKQKEKLQPTLFEHQVSSNEADETEPLDQDFPTGAKLKIIGALFIVGFAGYIAFWVQAPSDLEADLLASNSTQAEQEGFTQQVSIIDFSFDPININIQKGTTIVWTNKDAVPHNVTSDTFTSETLNSGDSFSHTFTEEGIFDYHCSFHPQMKGTLTVESATSITQETAMSQTQETAQVFHGAAETTDTQAVILPSDVLPTSDQTATELTSSSTIDPTAAQDNSEATNGQSLTTTDNLSAETVTTDIEDAGHGAAVEPLSVTAKKIVRSTKLSDSGPEDYLYFGVFSIILFLNRKKLLKIGNTL